MTLLDELGRELARVGIRGRLADRIVAELADHLECDPEAALGEPAEIADRFAAELRVVRTRRASLWTFGSLALAGTLLFVAIAAANAHRYVGGTGWIGPLSGLAMIATGQIAFVAGTLALARGLRGRTAADLALAQRRSFVALLAGGSACVALAVGAAAEQMPSWWTALAFVSALAPLPVLAYAAVTARSAAAVTPRAGDAVGVAGDLPVRPGYALLALGAAAVALVVLQGGVGEHSLVEGVARGGVEATGLLLGVVVLGPVLGLRSRSRRRRPAQRA